MTVRTKFIIPINALLAGVYTDSPVPVWGFTRRESVALKRMTGLNETRGTIATRERMISESIEMFPWCTSHAAWQRRKCRSIRPVHSRCSCSNQS
jgi:hypothetical protein